jgi:uncharacterized protein (DUF1800 family)
MRKLTSMVWDDAKVLGVVAVLGLVMWAAPAAAQTGALSSLTVANLSPAFSPAVKDYSTPRPSSCSLAVTATLANPVHRLYIASGETASGVTRQAWACGSTSKISIVIYAGWTEVGRYTITLVDMPPPPPPAPMHYLSALSVPNLSPAFSPAVKQYSIPRTTCSVTASAMLVDPRHKLYIANRQVASGQVASAWVCDGNTKFDVIVYQVWTEKARYTVNVVGDMLPPPPGPPPPPPPPPVPAFEQPPVPSPVPALPMDPLPQEQPTSAAMAERLLQQATFGPSAAEFAAVKAKGVNRWLAEQFRIAGGGMPDGLDNNQVRANLLLKMANGPDQMRQRMAFALGQTLVVSTNKLVNGYELVPFARLIENHAFGNYRTLLREITLSPSMGKYLDLVNSVGSGGSAPNENYPRELMQLFSIGLYQSNMDGTYKTAQNALIPTYDQAMVREVARALSGWTFPTQPGFAPASHNPEYYVGLMEPRPQRHDGGSKTVLGKVLPAGQTVTKDMEDVIDAVFTHPNVAPFVATRLIRALVTSNPTGAYIQRVANVFADNGSGVRGDLTAVLTAILTDPDASLPSTNDGRLRDPLLQVIGLARALGVQVGDPNQFMYLMVNFGQAPLSATTVFSFYSPLTPLPGNPTKFGPEFQIYSPALAIQRANFVHRLLNAEFQSSFAFNIAPYTALAGDPHALVEHVNQVLLFGRMSSGLRQVLVAAAQATSDMKQRALGTLYLTAISGEFLVYTGPSFLPN